MNLLAEKDLAPTEMGKGRNVWYCIGYILASGRGKAVILHDCDVVTYNRKLLSRLFHPVANPFFQYQFAKRYYTRIVDSKLNGRVRSLLVTPLIKSLKKVCDPSEYLEYMNNFRYSLSGEFSMRSELEPGAERHPRHL